MLSISACSDTPIVNVEEEKPDYKENVINANKYLIEREETSIKSYIERHGWMCTTMGCGVRIEETHKGEGQEINNDDTVTVCYSAEDLSGKTLYSDTTISYIAGRLEPTEGFDAAILTLRYGSEARMIVPSTAGYGVVGDGDAIGSRKAVVYHVKVKKQQKK